MALERRKQSTTGCAMNECNYVFEAEMPPDVCPGCHAKCTFMSVNCYIPDCGRSSNYDPRLVVAQHARESERRLK
jgi:rubredoxin